MKSIKSIIVCSSGYPTLSDPVAPFVEQIVNAYSLKGINVTVVAPQSITKHWLHGAELHPRKRIYTYKNGNPITVYQPYYLSFGGRFIKINNLFREWSINNTLKKNKIKADICYGHFWHHAFALFRFASKNKIPLFVVSGESTITCHKEKKQSKLKPFVEYISGLICVSTKNFNESKSVGLLTDDSKCTIIPNAIDNTLFYKMDKNLLRKKHGLKDNDFVVAFTGWYDENKGVMRVSEAINKLQDDNIKSFFIGDKRDGKGLMPNCKGILHMGRLPHDEMPEYLNIADVFVLPTLSEGCNNAIIEAMACGLPIISSNLPFNWDVLDSNNSIMVDPLNVDEIAGAIKLLKDNKQIKEKMSEAALKTASELTISKRAERMIAFMESKI